MGAYVGAAVALYATGAVIGGMLMKDIFYPELSDRRILCRALLWPIVLVIELMAETYRMVTGK